MSLDAGLALFGSVSPPPNPGGAPVVVLIRDRHSLIPAITRERGPLSEVRAQVRAAIAFLLEKDFRLLGCESPLGKLPEDSVARSHREAVEEALRSGDRLDLWTVYQPIRFQVEFGSRLAVLGVEDPDLYGSDREALVLLRRLGRAASPGGVSPEESNRMGAILIRSILANSDPRGAASARNLLSIMRERELDRAILLLGGGHTEGARKALEAEGAAVWIFEPRSYKAAGEHGSRSAGQPPPNPEGRAPMVSPKSLVDAPAGSSTV